MKLLMENWRKYLKEALEVRPALSGEMEAAEAGADPGETKKVTAIIDGTGPEDYKLQSVVGGAEPIDETPTIYEMWERLSKESPWNEYTADQQAVQAARAEPGSTAREPGEVYAPKISKGREYVIGDESQEGRQALKDLVSAYLKQQNVVDETWQTVEVQIGTKPETRKPYSGEPGTPWRGATKGAYAREEEMYQLPSMYEENKQ